jgi:hypothetical protein
MTGKHRSVKRFENIVEEITYSVPLRRSKKDFLAA